MLACVHANSELRSERAKFQENEFILQTKCLELQQALEDERISKAESLLRQKGEFEQTRRTLQV